MFVSTPPLADPFPFVTFLDQQAGLAVLLKSEKLFHSSFFSQAVHVRPVCQDWECKTTSLELRQTLNVVFDLYTSAQGKRGEQKSLILLYASQGWAINFSNESIFRHITKQK